MASTQRTLTRRLGLLAGGGAQKEKIEADNPHYEFHNVGCQLIII